MIKGTMRKIIYLIVFTGIFSITGIVGQSNQFAEKSDPEADRILDRLSKKMDAYKAYRVDFDVQIDVPDQDDENETGYLLHSGNKFIFDIPSQKIVANERSVYVHLKRDKEIQINDPDFGDDGSLLSPAQMMRIHETEDFIFVITDKNDQLTTIEFKPTDEFSDYSKVKVVIDHNQLVMQKMTIFSKDGSRIYLSIHDFIENPNLSADAFNFDVKAYPDCYVEDLRID